MSVTPVETTVEVRCIRDALDFFTHKQALPTRAWQLALEELYTGASRAVSYRRQVITLTKVSPS